MAVSNTVEATLVSKYVDGVSKGIERTEQIARQQMASMMRASASFGTATGASIDSATTALKNWRDGLRVSAEASESSFKKTSLAAAAMAVGIVASFILVGRSIVDFLLQKARAASELTELKLAFEGLAQASNWNVDTLGRLKKATEGLVSSSELLRNANRVMQSGVNVSSDMYVELTSNVFRLAKSAGKDGAQAMSILTDSLIKGNARGFQAIGIHLAVKDAISDMAAAAGASATSLGSAATMQAFYQELVEKTRAAVAKLPEDFISLEDAILRSEKAWNSFFLMIGEGVNRSGVLQQLLIRWTSTLDDLAAKKSDVENIATVTNRFLIDTLRGVAGLMEATSWIPTVINLITGLVQSAAMVLVTTAAAATQILTSLVVMVADLFGNLRGPMGQYFREVAERLRVQSDFLDKLTRETAKGVLEPWQGLTAAQQRMNSYAQSARQLAGDMEKFSGSVVKGTSALQAQGGAAASAAVDQKKLNEAVKEFEQMRLELVRSSLDSELRVYDEYYRTLDKLNASQALDEERKQEMRLLLVKKYAKELVRVQETVYLEATARALALDEMLGGLAESIDKLLADVTKLPAAPNHQPAAPTNLGDDPAYRVVREAEQRRQEEWKRIQDAARGSADRNTPDWAKPLVDLHLQMEKLNKVGMDPFHQTMAAMKASVADFAGEAGQAFANFFSDLVSGQEGAGKKFLAAFVGMIGQMLVKMGVMLIQVGAAEVALASTAFGRIFLQANAAAGWKAIAVGAVMAAAGGVMVGAASAMAQTNQAGASASFQQSVPRPTSGSAVQVIQVGAAGRSQSAGAATVNPTAVKHEVIVKLDKGLIAQEAARDIRNNGVLRVAVVGASA